LVIDELRLVIDDRQEGHPPRTGGCVVGSITNPNSSITNRNSSIANPNPEPRPQLPAPEFLPGATVGTFPFVN